MSESVKTVAAERKGTIVPGDVFMLNTPYNGGTHLPDITVITPVFDEAGRDILFYVASRGHHAEIGGITPGSVPPDSKHIDEEGVLIDNFQLVSGGRLLEKETEELFTTAPYPTRNFHHNLADLKAQIAANEKGVQELRKMVAHFGLDVVQAYMIHVQDNAEESVRRVLGVLKDGELLNTRWIRAPRSASTSRSTGKSARRSSTSPAPRRSRTATSTRRRRSAWRRCSTCSGSWSTTTSRSTAGASSRSRSSSPKARMLAPDKYPAAVVAGNVETSQAVTDALLGALGMMAPARAP